MPTLEASCEIKGKKHMSKVELLDMCQTVYRNYVCKLQQPLIHTKKNPSNIWEDHMKDLYRFKDTYGHCRVPHHYEKNPKLGRWVMNVRSHYQFIQKGKKSSLMTADRLKLLKDVDFVFAPKSKSYTKYYIDCWVHHLEELRRFKEKDHMW
jgi:Helicase associated domain